MVRPDLKSVRCEPHWRSQRRRQGGLPQQPPWGGYWRHALTLRRYYFRIGTPGGEGPRPGWWFLACSTATEAEARTRGDYEGENLIITRFCQGHSVQYRFASRPILFGGRSRL